MLKRFSFMEKLNYIQILLGVGALSWFGFAWNYWLAGAVLGGILIIRGISGLVGISRCCRVDDKGNKVCEVKQKPATVKVKSNNRLQ